jgi:hypothetical protein
MHRAPFSKVFIGTNPPCHMVLGVLTSKLPGTQQAPRSGILLLRVRAERNVKLHLRPTPSILR